MSPRNSWSADSLNEFSNLSTRLFRFVRNSRKRIQSASETVRDAERCEDSWDQNPREPREKTSSYSEFSSHPRVRLSKQAQLDTARFPQSPATQEHQANSPASTRTKLDQEEGCLAET